MNIGKLVRGDTGTVTGYIAEASFDFDAIFLEKVASDNPRAPLFNMMTKSPRGRDVRLGSIWERAAKETGEVYFRGYIETAKSGLICPLLSGPKTMIVWTTKGTMNAEQEAQAGRDYRQAA
ncbi:DUF736 family protein [Sphingobium soli]|uniref:DUF736 family protein n=1 Tax=Sphingobium soli TaxID=1591116 RepID=A0ABS8H4M8_9SPHN|nr:DUF736 family protein [Sphingobium soli]MCC4233353.1 DUF736 family protein [Sphingobium soli]